MKIAKGISSLLNIDFKNISCLLKQYKFLNIDPILHEFELSILNCKLNHLSVLPKLSVLRNVLTKCKYLSLFKLFQLSLTISVAFVISDWLISALTGVHNYSRTTIRIDRDHAMSILAIERDILFFINNFDIIDAFATHNLRANFVW